MNEEIEKIWVHLNRAQASQEATDTLLQAVLSLVKDDPRLPPALRAVLDARTADRLNRGAINDDFIHHYLDMVRAMTPPGIQHQVLD